MEDVAEEPETKRLLMDTGTGPDDRCGYTSHEECKTAQRDDPTALSNCFKQK
jgi:hypothetical protein